MPEYQAPVNHDFMPGVRRYRASRRISRLTCDPPHGVRTVSASAAGRPRWRPTLQDRGPCYARDRPASAEVDSAREILELLNSSSAAMIRQLERAARFGGRRRRAPRPRHCVDHPRPHRRPERPQHRRAVDRRHLCRMPQTGSPIRPTGIARQQVRERRQAGRRAAAAAAREATANVDRLRESSAAIGNVVNLIAQIARQTTLLALNSTIEAARAGAAGKRLCRGRDRGEGARRCRPRVRPRRSPRRSRRCRSDATGSADAVHRISAGDRGDPPGVRQRQRRGRRAEHDHRRDRPATRPRLAASSSRSAPAPPRSMPRRRTAEAHGDSVASSRQGRYRLFAQKLKSRCAVLLRQGERGDPPQDGAAALPA